MAGRRDATALFKQIVDERTGLDRKLASVASEEHRDGRSPSHEKQGSKSHPILPNSKRSPFIATCLSINTLLVDLEEFLKKNRMAYLQGSRVSVASGVPSMSERERQKVDQEADQCLKECESTIRQLQAKLEEFQPQKQSAQILDHRSRVLLYLVDVYARVSQAYFKQKSDRLANALEERQGYTKAHGQILLDQRSRAPVDTSFQRSPSPSPSNSNQPPSQRDSPSQGPQGVTKISSDSSSPQPLSTATIPLPPRKKGDIPSKSDEDIPFSRAETYGRNNYVQRAVADNVDSGMSAQLQDQLRKENVVLQASLVNMSDDIRQVEQQIIVISQAQQLIAHNLMQQRDDLENIHKQTKDATVHIKKGNTDLEKAAQSGSKFRIFVLIFLLTMSFLLLFLHRIEA